MICFVRYYLYTKNAAMYHFIIFFKNGGYYGRFYFT